MLARDSFASMESLETRTLVDTLQAELRRQLESCSQLRLLPLDELHTGPAPKRWSVMEVVQHMNLSSGHYHKRLQKLYADENNGLRFRTRYTPGRWGDYSTKAMDPKADGTISWRMRTMAMFEPRNVANSGLQALDEFEAMLHGFMGLLERARTRGLEGEKVTSTLGPILRFKAGDAFRFPIAHQTRHFLQIERTLEDLD
jgi:hypothetical protein